MQRVEPKNIAKALILIALLLFSIRHIDAQVPTGLVKKGLSVDSKVLGKRVSYSIYLPFDYQTSTRSYPVVYLLHGGGADHVQWIESGNAAETADEAIANRKIPPIILVMPDAGFSRFINSYDKAVCYEDFFFSEFIPNVESTYRVKPQKQFRAVGGLSMGGYGSLIYALRHPEMFAACVALSASLYTDEMTLGMSQEEWDRSRTVAFGKGLKGKARITSHYQTYDPFRIVQTADPERLRMVKFYLDCGDDDFRTDGNAIFHMLLRKLKIPHEYRVRDGDHTWDYWRSGLGEGLKFIGDVFRSA